MSVEDLVNRLLQLEQGTATISACCLEELFECILGLATAFVCYACAKRPSLSANRNFGFECYRSLVCCAVEQAAQADQEHVPKC